MKFEKLPKSEQNILTQLYGQQLIGTKGYNPQTILYVEELSPEEEYYFDKNTGISPNLFVQKLYKISGNLIPLRFNLAVNNLIKNNDAFRMNYCQVDNRTLKVIFDQRRELPEIVYRNLENVADIDSTLKNIIEADIRQGFDLAHGHLIRFSVFHTADEEYAVLVTVAKLIENSFDTKNFFREVMNLETVAPITKDKTFSRIQMTQSMQNYWSKVLENMPDLPILPYLQSATGFYKQKAYYTTIPADIMSDLREKAQSNKMMLMAIFETAWAMLLQEFNKSQDVAFATVVPSKTDENFNMIPVRLQADKQTIIQETVNQQFKQLIVSQPYASVEIIELQGKKFDHFLSFTDFLKDEAVYSEVEAKPDGQLVLQNSWNTKSMKLSLYFHYAENVTSISILYDEKQFTFNFGEILSKRYILILQQMLTDWNLNYENFINRLSIRIEEVSKESKREDVTAYLQNFISQLVLLQGINEGTLQKILQISKLETYFEGDRISGAEIEQNLIFIAEGKLVRSIEANDGWYKTLDIIKENGWINETVLSENRKNKLSAEILTEKALLMLIPLEDMNKLLKEFPDVEYKILQYVLNQMEKYQRLWIQS